MNSQLSWDRHLFIRSGGTGTEKKNEEMWIIYDLKNYLEWSYENRRWAAIQESWEQPFGTIPAGGLYNDGSSLFQFFPH